MRFKLIAREAFLKAEDRSKYILYIIVHRYILYTYIYKYIIYTCIFCKGISWYLGLFLGFLDVGL